MLGEEGRLLGGRVRYSQPATGFRSGIEPVLLAASLPARPRERVLEAGTGAGAAILCLSARVPGALATGVEIDPALAALAAANAEANAMAGISVVAGAIEAYVPDRPFDHAIANPPYHPPSGTVSPDAARATAKRGSAALIDAWIASLARALRDRGTLTLIVSAPVVPACLMAMERQGCPCSTLFPLWPKAGRAAKLVLLRGIRGGRAPFRVAGGLVLHTEGGAFTEAAERILREGGGLDLGG